MVRYSFNVRLLHSQPPADFQRRPIIGIVGPRAGELIAEGVLAVEMGATLEDLVVTIHPHPTLSETIMEAATVAMARLERQKAQKAKEPVAK